LLSTCESGRYGAGFRHSGKYCVRIAVRRRERIEDEFHDEFIQRGGTT